MASVNPTHYNKGDILFYKRQGVYFLVLDKGTHENNIYYKTLNLNDGIRELIGYWDYMIPAEWVLWA